MKRISVSMCLILMIMVQLVGCTNQSKNYYETTQLSEYGTWSTHIEEEREQIHSGLYIFPVSVSDTQNARYIYKCGTDSLGNNEYCIVLDVLYDSDAFKNETARLQAITCDVKISDDQVITNQVKYNEARYRLPAYVAIYASNYSFEYALVDEQNSRIQYVYLQTYNDSFVSDCELSDDLFHERDFGTVSWDNTNIYYAKNDRGDYVFYTDHYVN